MLLFILFRHKIKRFLFPLILLGLLFLWRAPRTNQGEVADNADSDSDVEADCSLYYILAGRHSNYQLGHVTSWMKDSPCSIHLLRPTNRHLFANLTEKEENTIELLSARGAHPVILADYLKLLSLYYSPSDYSLVFDFDVKLLKSFPTQWSALQGCSVFWSIENDCYDSSCSSQYDGRTAQITTWIEVSLRPKSVILRHLIDFISDRLLKLDDSPGGLNILRTQDYAGSGPITMFLKQELGLDYTEIPISHNSSLTLKESTGSILKIPFKDEVICIGGQATAGNSCSYTNPTPSTCLVKHYFEGTWKSKGPSLLSKIWSFLFGSL